MPIVSCQAILFDLDGVLVDSRETVERIWHQWAETRGLNPNDFIRVAHGRRISETLRMVAPHLDIDREVAELDAMELVVTTGTRVAPGAATILNTLPRDRWGIVTSGSDAVARLRLGTAGLPVPDVFITAERVKRGKPDPQGYAIGAEQLGRGPAHCLVFEDAPPGVAAGKAAGMRVVALLTTHQADALASADARIPDLSHVTVRAGGPNMLVEF
ncbi:MAG: HAD family hydrolase [Gemmatimonadota bacterium]